MIALGHGPSRELVPSGQVWGPFLLSGALGTFGSLAMSREKKKKSVVGKSHLRCCGLGKDSCLRVTGFLLPWKKQSQVSAEVRETRGLWACHGGGAWTLRQKMVTWAFVKVGVGSVRLGTVVGFNPALTSKWVVVVCRAFW